MARRYSSMALLSVAVLVLAGIYMAWFYVGTWNGLYGTSYGVLLLAKIYLLLVMLLMGTGNWMVARRLNTDPQPLLARLRRFAEAEIGLGFTVILAAASMSAQPPAVDVPDQVSLQVDCRPHASGSSAHEEPSRCRSLLRPLRSKPRCARPSSRPTGAAMPPTGNGRSTTIIGRA